MRSADPPMPPADLGHEEIQLTAGAGLVKDSICLNEVQEIKLKFEAIAKHIFY